MGTSHKETRSQSNSNSTERRDPWAPSLPFINDTMGNARNVFNSDAGTQYFPGYVSTPMSWDTSYALDAIRNRAIGGSPLNSAAQQQALNTINGDYFNPTNDFYNTGMSGGLNNNSASLYSPLIGANMSPSLGYYGQIASGQNPYLDQTYQNAARNISDTVNSNFSKAGRYGSAAHQSTLTRDLGNFANDLYGNNYQADQNRRLNAANSMQQSHDNHMNRYMNAANSISNIQDQNIQRQFASAQGLGQNFQSERARQMQAIANAGQMAANDYADYDRLMGVGRTNEEQEKRDLMAAIERFNYFENLPYNRASQFANMALGYANLGGTNTSNTSSSGSGSESGFELNLFDLASKLKHGF